MPRVAIIGTPRSGNSWLRKLLSGALGCESIAIHHPADIAWSQLPADGVVQIHWPPDPPMLERLEAAGVQVVTPARHPLGVLVSILHFSAFEDETARWLDGAGGDERGLIGASPASEEFLRYAVGSRAHALLSVTPAWWERRHVVRIRYEDLASDPDPVTEGLLAKLGARARVPVPEVVRENRLAKARRTSRNQHFWQGDPALWRRVVPPDVAARIASRHGAILDVLGYCCDPDPSLDALTATARWLRMSVTSSREQIRELRDQIGRLESLGGGEIKQRRRPWPHLRTWLRRS